jgi:tetratricopeptide (TPR) repeat protein
LAAFVLAVVVLVTFGGVLSQGFVHWDDDLHITNNPALNPPTWVSVGRFWLEPYEDLYIPLSYTFFAAETVLADALVPRRPGEPTNAIVFKAASLMLHWGCACLVWGLIRRWTSNGFGALFGAMLFAIHPVQVESVAWTSETRGLLATTLGLGALALHPAANEPARRRIWRESLALVLFAGSLLAKPQLVILAPLVVLSDCLGREEPVGTALRRSWPWWCLAGIGFGVTQLAQSAGRLPFTVTVLERVQIACDSLGFYLVHLVWPSALGIDYGRTPSVALSQSLWLFGAAFIGMVAIVIWRGSRLARLSCALLILGLLPTLGLVPFAFQAISTVADRYAYVAMLGLALAMSLLLGRHASPVKMVLGGGLLVLMGIVSHQQVTVWGSDQKLFEHALVVNPRSPIAWNNLGRAKLTTGDEAGALAAFERAVELNPRSSVALYNLGVLAEQHGNESEAGRFFKEAAQQPEARAKTLVAWARWLARQNRNDEAVNWYHRALDVDPRHTNALTELGSLIQLAGESAEAGRLLEQAVAADPSSWSARVAFGHYLLEKQNLDQAVAQYEAALALRDNLADPLFNLGLIRARQGALKDAEGMFSRSREAALAANDSKLASAATSELVAVLQGFGLQLFEAGQIPEAIEKFQRACELDESSAPAHFHLGRAYLAQGDSDAARRELARALELVPADSPASHDIQTVLESVPGGAP